MYENEIRLLEKQYEKINNDIAAYQTKPDYDHKVLVSMNQQRSMYYSQLSSLRRKKYEEDHERVGYGDD